MQIIINTDHIDNDHQHQHELPHLVAEDKGRVCSGEKGRPAIKLTLVKHACQAHLEINVIFCENMCSKYHMKRNQACQAQPAICYHMFSSQMETNLTV